MGGGRDKCGTEDVEVWEKKVNTNHHGNKELVSKVIRIILSGQRLSGKKKEEIGNEISSNFVYI